MTLLTPALTPLGELIPH